VTTYVKSGTEVVVAYFNSILALLSTETSFCAVLIDSVSILHDRILNDLLYKYYLRIKYSLLSDCSISLQMSVNFLILYNETHPPLILVCDANTIFLRPRTHTLQRNFRLKSIL
jgi:hypothetical protein